MSTGREILRTSTAKCRDCYRCVRGCPVKAIGIRNSQAFIETTRCILCGKCVKECPQRAKSYRSDVDRVIELIKDKEVVASVAPSFGAFYSGTNSNKLPTALRQLGFSKVEETSNAKLFALPGGMLETAGIDSGIKNRAILHVSGAVNTISLLEATITSPDMRVIEPLFCRGGLYQRGRCCQHKESVGTTK